MSSTKSSKLLSIKYLAFGGGQFEPNSCTCIPKKHTSMPPISSKAKIALARYGKLSAISGLPPSGPGIQNLAFIPGRTSTTFSELERTRIVTSPAPASLRLRNELTRFSRYVPSLVWGNPVHSAVKQWMYRWQQNICALTTGTRSVGFVSSNPIYINGVLRTVQKLIVSHLIQFMCSLVCIKSEFFSLNTV